MGASTSSSQHHRRDSSGLRLDPPQLPPSNTNNVRNNGRSSQASFHNPNTQNMNSLHSRARSTSATTLEHLPQPSSTTSSSLDYLLEQARKRPPQFDEQMAAQVVLDEEPLYVNAKQYHRILKRRVARARLAEVQRLSTQRKVYVIHSNSKKLVDLTFLFFTQPYLHQSRHNHAVRRPRGPGGRFLTAEEIAARKHQGHLDQSPPDQEQEGDMIEENLEEVDMVNLNKATSGSSESPMQDLDSSTPKEDVINGHATVAEKSGKQGQILTNSAFGYGTVTAATASDPSSSGDSTSALGFDSEAFPAILGTGSVLGEYTFGSVVQSE